MRTPQRPQPVFDPNRVCLDFTFCCHKCTHFAWPIYTYVEACGSNTLLGPAVQSKCYPVCVHLYGILLLLVHTLGLAQVAVQLDTSYTHSWCTHCAWISCTAVHLYFSPVSVHSGTVYTTALYKCTLASASLASILSTNHRRAWIYLLCSDWSIRHHP